MTIRLLILSSLALLLTNCSNESSNQAVQTIDNIPAVEAVQSQFGSLPLVERFSGNVTSENQVELYPEVTAQVKEVFVENGQYVKKGQKLVQLEDEPFQKQLQQAEAGLKINEARLKQAEARLAELEAQYNRTVTLAEKNLSSELELERISAQKISAEADVELVEAQLDQSRAIVAERKDDLSRTVITAPVSGTIGQRNAKTGMQATTSTKLFMIGDLTKLRIEIVLTESMLSKIKVGQTAAIRVPNSEGDDIVIEAELSRISPFLNETTRSTEAEIDVDNQANILKPGMYVPVDVYFGDSQQATLIPTSAIFIDPNTGNEGVYIANSIGSEIEPVSETSEGLDALTAPTSVIFQEIDVVARGKMEVGIQGLESGQWVVTMGQFLLSEGKKTARVKTTTWEHVLGLQQLQREDLLKEIMKPKTDKNSKAVSL